MTISSISNRVSYAGNGSTTAFAVPYPFFAGDELLVIIETDSDGSEATQTLTTDYTVSGGSGSTGTVTMVTAPASGETLHIIRDTDAVQETDLVNNSAMDAEVLEDALDRRAMREQRLFEHIERALRVPETEAALARLPKADDRKNTLFYFNSSTGLPDLKTAADLGLTSSATSGETLASYTAIKAKDVSGLSGGDSLFVVSRSSVGDGGHGWFAWRSGDQSANITADPGEGVWVPPDSDATGASGAWQRLVAGVYRAEWFGAVGGGTTDDQSALQNAVNYLNSETNGAILELGHGQFLLGSTLTLKANVKLRGQGEYPGIWKLNSTQATEILVDTGVTTGITSSQNDVGLEGIVVVRKGLAYPQDATAVSGWSGTGISMSATGVSLRNMMVAGFNQGVDISSSARVAIEKLYLDNQNGLKVSGSVDIDRLEGVHCWPFLSNNNTSSDDVERTGVGVYTDGTGAWTRLENCFAIGYKIGFRTTDTNHTSWVNCATDYVATPSINAQARGFQIDGDAKNTKIVGCTIGGPYTHGVWVDISGTGTASGVLVADTEFSGTAAAVEVNVKDAEFVQLDNCIFLGGTIGVRVSSDMGLELLVDGCQFNNVTTVIAYGGSGFTSNRLHFSENNRVIGATNIWANPIDQTASVASAGTVELPANERFIQVTGTTTIGTFKADYPGRVVSLEFTAGLTVSVLDNIITKTGSNTTFSAGDHAVFVCAGSVWYQAE